MFSTKKKFARYCLDTMRCRRFEKYRNTNTIRPWRDWVKSLNHLFTYTYIEVMLPHMKWRVCEKRQNPYQCNLSAMDVLQHTAGKSKFEMNLTVSRGCGWQTSLLLNRKLSSNWKYELHYIGILIFPICHAGHVKFSFYVLKY